jgi:hypothetical protein
MVTAEQVTGRLEMATGPRTFCVCVVCSVVLLLIAAGCGTSPPAAPDAAPPAREPAPDQVEATTERPLPVSDADDLCGLPRTRLVPLTCHRLMQGLGHLPDTDPELRAEIDTLCATLVDFLAGRAGIDAQDRLAEIGKPAVPLVIASFEQCGDLESLEGMCNACVVDEALRTMVGSPTRLMPLKPMANPDKNQIQRAAKEWAVWWFCEGYRQARFDPEP